MVNSAGLAPRVVSKNGGMTLEQFQEWLMKYDKNNDGKISSKELHDAFCDVKGESWFKGIKSEYAIRKADRNGDGVVDDDEIIYLVDFARRKLGLKIVSV
ncbi:polcalcin Phl p 7-like [Olea europaea subsp. europaea]|uniref:Polcalcin Phl p 7-like n=1 Tax=Olea europaea subsp. europaea TaxID=158383 RepID=A0A8S0ST59_OLEEU|nr:polcalcin Phl p 7-like [Olea europaea subsp. europaea]